MKYLLTALVLVLLGFAAWYFLKTSEPVAEQAVAPAPVAVAPPPAQTPATPPVRETTPEYVPPATETQTEPAAPPLPPLAQSDSAVIGALSVVIGEEAVKEYVAHEDVVPRIVATVDALSGKQVPSSIRVVQGPPGDFLADPDPEPPEVLRNSLGDPLPQYVLDPANYARYTPYVQALEGAEAATIVTAYHSYQPLFDEAFSQLGYPEGDFEERLLALIDELLATPDPPQPVRLIKPEAYYKYADESLEALSAGQKVLLRMGPDNAARVKAQLRAIRTQLQAG